MHNNTKWTRMRAWNVVFYSYHLSAAWNLLLLLFPRHVKNSNMSSLVAICIARQLYVRIFIFIYTWVNGIKSGIVSCLILAYCGGSFCCFLLWLWLRLQFVCVPINGYEEGNTRIHNSKDTTRFPAHHIVVMVRCVKIRRNVLGVIIESRSV